jgi:hypothetical protein
VSCYALFQGWLLLSQPPGCLRARTSLPTQPTFGTLAGGLGCSPLDPGPFRPRSHSRRSSHDLRRLTRLGRLRAPAPHQRPTATACPPRLTLKPFRGEPAISELAWHFTPTPSSSEPFATDTGSALHAGLPSASAWPGVARPVSGRPPATVRPLRTRLRSGFGCPSLRLATNGHSPAHAPIGTPSPAHHRLRPPGGAWFQALFHPPRRGPFHRSLTVLVHYRSAGVLSLGEWSPLLPAGVLVPGSTRAPIPEPLRHRLRDSHPLRSRLPAAFGWPSGCSLRARSAAQARWAAQPRTSFRPAGHLARAVWALPVSLATTPGLPLASSGY